MTRFVFTAALCALAPCALPQDRLADRQMHFWVFGGRSVIFLGSEDQRHIVGAALQFSKPDKRLSFRQNEARLVIEGYAMESFGGRPGRPQPTSLALGFLAMGRFEHSLKGDVKYYWETGWGFQVANRTTNDLESALNSTPTIGAGLILPYKDSEMRIGVRYLHISNAGTQGRNLGQNQFHLLLGWKLNP